jgi:hypothetical protein
VAGAITIAGLERGLRQMVEVDHGNGLATRHAQLPAINAGAG